MGAQIFLKFGMVTDVVVFLDEGGILVEIPRDVRVSAEEFAEMLVSRVRIATTRFRAVIAAFRAHEGSRIFPNFLTDTLVIPQIRLQLRMIVQELLVIQKRGILADLLGDRGACPETGRNWQAGRGSCRG